MSGFNAKECTAIVTGGNRGIGKAIVEALLESGAAKVYAGARKPQSLSALTEQYRNRVVPIELDVTDHDQVMAAAKLAGDANLVVNNAGILYTATGLGDDDLQCARQEMEVNYFGVLDMMRAFAPGLQRNGGGAVVNVASIVSQVNMPMINTYSASKAAVWSLSIGLRAALADQGTRVMTVHPGPIDTDMAAEVEMEKFAPSMVAEAMIKGLQDGVDEVFPDPMSEGLFAQWRADPKGTEAQFAAMAVSQPV